MCKKTILEINYEYHPDFNDFIIKYNIKKTQISLYIFKKISRDLRI